MFKMSSTYIKKFIILYIFYTHKAFQYLIKIKQFDFLVKSDILLVTACFDNSGFSGVVTLNSPGGVFPR